MDNDILKKIASDFGTPSYVFDIDELTGRLSVIQQILGNDIRVVYAVKANPFLIRAVKDMGIGFEVCSPGEFSICENEDVDMESVVLSGVNKERADVGYVMDKRGGSGIYTIESIAQLQLISSLAREKGIKARVLLRVTSGNQFGLDETDIERIAAGRDDYPDVDIRGIQCYTGTQKKKMDHIAREIDWLDGICDRLYDRYGFRVRELEYGPGLSVPYFEPDADNDNYDMLMELARKLDSIRGKYDISLEMGRYIAATCGYLLTTIMDMKVNREQRYCIVDSGINHINYYGQTMAMKIPVIKHIHMDCGKNDGERGVSQWNICGSLCTAGDIIVKNLMLDNPQPGDVLVFCNIGAYSVTEGIYLFLSRSLPGIIEYKETGGAVLLRDRVPTYTFNSSMYTQ